MADVLFCPFCRESFEGEARCPEHELVLVPFFELPREKRGPADDERLAWYSPGLGRGPVAACAMLMLLAFVALPLAVVEGPTPMGGSMLLLANESTPRLWLLPAAAMAVLLILYRRRTPAGMRGLRVVVPLLALLAVGVVGWSYAGVVEALELLSERTREPLVPQWGSGAYLVWAGALGVFGFGVRLGVTR